MCDFYVYLYTISISAILFSPIGGLFGTSTTNGVSLGSGRSWSGRPQGQGASSWSSVSCEFLHLNSFEGAQDPPLESGISDFSIFFFGVGSPTFQDPPSEAAWYQLVPQNNEKVNPGGVQGSSKTNVVSKTAESRSCNFVIV